MEKRALVKNVLRRSLENIKTNKASLVAEVASLEKSASHVKIAQTVKMEFVH